MAADGDLALAAVSAKFPSTISHFALVAVGEPLSEEYPELILKEIQKGLQNWDIDAESTGYNDVLQAVAEANVSQIGALQRSFAHAGSTLGIAVLINPTTTTLATEIQQLLCHPAPNKHIIFGGHHTEVTGNWVLHNDTFTLTDIVDVFAEPEVDNALLQSSQEDKHTLVVSGCHWSAAIVAKQAFSKSLNLVINPSESKHDINGISLLLDTIRSQIVILQPFELLEPPTMGMGVKCKITKPTVLIFPAAKGDCGFFAVGDFSIFIGGGYCPKSCFWKFAKHLNRVDAVLLPHMQPDSLLGINSLLQRKLAEAQLEQPEPESESYEDWQTKCNSPELGVIYMNAPTSKKVPAHSLTLKATMQGYLTAQLAKELSRDPISCMSGSGKTIEPITLFQKVGIGKLEMFILTPVQGSKEMKDFATQWGTGKAFSKVKTGVKVSDKDAESSLLDAVSVCALIVWQPWDPDEDIIRVLFPGNAPQNKIFEGLDRIKHLDFLKYADVTARRIANGGKGPVKKKPGSATGKPVAKPAAKANGPVKKSPSPTKEATVCEDGIHCNTPPPSPTGECTDGVHCNTPPPGPCADGIHCNTPPPDQSGPCKDGIHCNTPPQSPTGECTDGVHCNTPPPEGKNVNIFFNDGKCKDGVHCNTPPPEEPELVFNNGKCEDGIHCNTPPPEEEETELVFDDGKCNDGIHCNTPPPEEEYEAEDNGAVKCADALPVESDGADYQDPLVNVKQESLPEHISTDKFEDGDYDGAVSSGHGTANTTPNQSKPTSAQDLLDLDLDQPNGSHGTFENLPPQDLDLCGASAFSADGFHDSSGIDTEESPSPERANPWEPSFELTPDKGLIPPPDLLADQKEADFGKNGVKEGEDQEESSEDVSQASEIEVKPTPEVDDNLPEVKETQDNEESPTEDVMIDFQATGELDANDNHEVNPQNVPVEETEYPASLGDGDIEPRDGDMEPGDGDIEPGDGDIAPSGGPQLLFPVGDIRPPGNFEDEKKESMEVDDQEFPVVDVHPEPEEMKLDVEHNDDEIVPDELTKPDGGEPEVEPVEMSDIEIQEQVQQEVQQTFEESGEVPQTELVKELNVGQDEQEIVDDAPGAVDEQVLGQDKERKEDEVPIEMDVPCPPPPEVVFDDLAAEEHGEIEDDSLEARMGTDEDSLEVKLDGVVEERSVEEDKDAFQEKDNDVPEDELKQQSAGIDADVSDQQVQNESIEEGSEELKEDDSLEAAVPKEEDDQGLDEQYLQEEVNVSREGDEDQAEEVSGDLDSVERNQKVERLFGFEPQFPDEQVSASFETSEESKPNEKSIPQDSDQVEKPQEEQNFIPEIAGIASAPAGIGINVCMVDESLPSRQPEEQISGHPEELFIMTESQNTSDGVMELEDVSAASEDIPVEIPSVTPGVTPVIDPAVFSAIQVVPKFEPPMQEEQLKKVNEEQLKKINDEQLKKINDEQLKKINDEQLKKINDEPTKVPKPKLTNGEKLKPKEPEKKATKTGVKTTVTTKTTTTKRTIEKKSPTETKLLTDKKPFDTRPTTTATKKATTTAEKHPTSKKIPEKKTAAKKTVQETPRNGTKTKGALADKKPTKAANGVKITTTTKTSTKPDATRKSLNVAAKSTAKKTESQRPGSTARTNGPVKKSADTTKKSTDRPARSAPGARGDAKKNGIKRVGSATTKSPAASKSTSIPSSGPAVYVDLAYIPNHGAAENVNSEFFRRIRAKNYVISGDDKSRGRPSLVIFDSLLEGKLQWEDAEGEVVLIPTHDLRSLREWERKKQEELAKAQIVIAVPASRSIVQMKDENFFMYKVEFDHGEVV